MHPEERSISQGAESRDIEGKGGSMEGSREEKRNCYLYRVCQCGLWLYTNKFYKGISRAREYLALSATATLRSENELTYRNN